jgi:hypothetical protein
VSALTPEERRELDRWLAIHLFGLPEMLVDALALGPRDVSSSYEGMGACLEALFARGWGLSSLWWDIDGYGAEFCNEGGLTARGPSCERAPEAIALAARAAIESEAGR